MAMRLKRFLKKAVTSFTGNKKSPDIITNKGTDTMHNGVYQPTQQASALFETMSPLPM